MPCPTHRDVFLQKRLRKRGAANWGRVAGVVIEEFLCAVYEEHRQNSTHGAVGTSPADFARVARHAYERFRGRERTKKMLEHLRALRATEYDLSAEELSQILVNTAAADLFSLQGALNYDRMETEGPALRALSALETGRTLEPAGYLRLSKATPDLVLPKFKAIGDVKSGAFKRDYLMTVVGYALAYESATKSDIDVGVLYLVETEDRGVGFSRARFFWLMDSLRQEFIDRRNDVLAALEKKNEPEVLTKVADREKYCARCSHRGTCFPEEPRG